MTSVSGKPFTVPVHRPKPAGPRVEWDGKVLFALATPRTPLQSTLELYSRVILDRFLGDIARQLNDETVLMQYLNRRR